MPRNYIILLACLLSVLGCESGKQESITLAEQQNDRNFETKAEEKLAQFVADVVQTNYAEIKLAELAAAKSANKDVQDLAANLVAGYSRSLTSFQKFAQSNEIATPVDEGEASKRNVNNLFSQEDAHFDRKWCNELLIENKKGIRTLESALEKFHDDELKRIINTSLSQRRSNASKFETLSRSLDKN